MSKLSLDNLFGSKSRFKVLKFLFRNYPNDFNIAGLARMVQEKPNEIRKEINLMQTMGLIKKKTARAYILNPNFEFFNEIKALVLKSSPAEKDRLVKKIVTLGRIRLAIISGIFLSNYEDSGSNNSVADLLIVGDDINRKKLRTFLRGLEAEVGRELRFSLMDKEEFDYRFSMFDRFVRVMLEGPHEKIINRLGI